MAMELAAPISAATLEGVVVNGDLSKLTPAQRLEWYNSRCAAAGLDPRTQPFQYIVLSGKLTLYATKAATDQLIAIHKLNVQIVDRRADKDLGIYEVQVRVIRSDGSTVDDLAAVTIAGLKGDALCNAYMKCATKAKRRTVLSACGLGALDESEVETIPGARVGGVSIETGEIVGQKAADPLCSEAQVKAIADQMARVGWTGPDFRSYAQGKYGKSMRGELTVSEADEVIAFLRSLEAKPAEPETVTPDAVLPPESADTEPAPTKRGKTTTKAMAEPPAAEEDNPWLEPEQPGPSADDIAKAASAAQL